MKNFSFEEIVQKIKALEIQGAERIALAAVQAWALRLQETEDQARLEKYAAELMEARSTEPALRNALYYCLQNYKATPNISEKVIQYFRDSKIKIAKYGAKKIHDKMIVMTHCHSSTVEDILVKAWEEGRRFVVYNTETRPRYQGRITATNIAAHGIPVEHFIDSAGRVGMKKADLFLFGCDAISAEGNIINKIGTRMLLEFAKKYDVPAYSCTNSWKFNPDTVWGADEVIEERDAVEVWAEAPQGIKIHNPAFEVSAADDISGVISELGILKSEALIIEIQKNYPWMIKK